MRLSGPWHRLRAMRWLIWACLSLVSVAAAAQSGSYEQFFTAIQRDDARTVQRLHARGFDLNSPSPELQPPLFLAIRNDSLKVAQYLVGQPEVDVNALSTTDETPLMLAAIRGHLDLVKALTARGAQVNRPGWTPLHYAASHDGPNAEVITAWLLEHHAFIDAESPNGTTPLMMAAMYGLSDVVDLLLREGADPHARNQQGLTATDFAQRADRPRVAEAIAQVIRQRNGTGRW